ncbi:SCO6745 family protein [Frankia sp. ACN1ag]|uniref:SCO6745 family protein n=1 Tax=Frankia sp. ACN1ag TaxID=102891 RepID=UPI00070766A1|nr:hypothetical protein [Frankia sp. ACN1ag]KQC36696.1 hypothetical protein UK82_19905 [Frankia sp. ACN1ag]
MDRNILTDGEAAGLDVARTRPALLAIEPTFGAGVLCPAVHAALHRLDLGLDDVAVVNLVTRAAPLGPAPADVVVATFYNVNPRLVASVIPAVWRKASPEAILAAQQAAFAPVLAAALAPIDPAELGELAELARAAGEAAAANREGRPLLAGLASLPWPREDPLVIWHAAKVLREHRGDGHIGGLVIEGLRGIDALVVHAAYEGWPGEALRDSRRWDAAAWDASVASLRRRGWLTEAGTPESAPELTVQGRRRRRWIEDRTDELAALAYEPIGDAGMDRMIELGAKVVAALGAAGLATRLRRPVAR